MIMPRRILRVLSSDRALNWVGIGTALLIGAVFILVLVFGPGVRSDTQAVRNVADVQGCRSFYGTGITEARSALDQVNSELTEANHHTDVAENGVIRAATLDDDKNVPALLAALSRREAIADEITERLVDARAAMAEATTVYITKTSLSLSDPDEFLAQCRKEQS